MEKRSTRDPMKMKNCKKNEQINKKIIIIKKLLLLLFIILFYYYYYCYVIYWIKASTNEVIRL